MDADTSDLDVVLLKARLKSIEDESALLHELVKLQRNRIAQLQQEMNLAPREPEVSATRTETGVCRHCGKPAKQGQVFCQRACFYAWQTARKHEREAA